MLAQPFKVRDVELTNVVEPEHEHRQAFESHAPRADRCHAAQRFGDLRSEDAGATKFDMIVTDLNMPKMDGLTMIRELRKQPAQAGVPIIFLTTESDADMKAQAKAAGATGWLVKPFVPEQLTKVARKVLGR